jgi:hypothetical protein
VDFNCGTVCDNLRGYRDDRYCLKDKQLLFLSGSHNRNDVSAIYNRPKDSRVDYAGSLNHQESKSRFIPDG